MAQQKGGLIMVLGIPDFWIWSAYLLCVGSAIACVVYGAINWNRGVEIEVDQIDEEVQWAEKELEVEKKL